LLERQPLLLLRAVLGGAAVADAAIAAWVDQELVRPVEAALRRISDDFLSRATVTDVGAHGQPDFTDKEVVFLLEDGRAWI
jgi:hypothetical protein